MPGVCKEETFKQVFAQHARNLRDFLYYKTRNLDQAEDLVQEAFVALWENCSKVTAEKARSFLMTVANNKFLNQAEHKKVVLRFENMGHTQRSDVDPQFLMEEEEFRKRLQEAISNLPEDQRVVFLMNRVNKKKYREIAEELGVSIKTVEKRMHKALKALREVHHKI